jgi:hypothetical protein
MLSAAAAGALGGFLVGRREVLRGRTERRQGQTAGAGVPRPSRVGVPTRFVAMAERERAERRRLAAALRAHPPTPTPAPAEDVVPPARWVTVQAPDEHLYPQSL